MSDERWRWYRRTVDDVVADSKVDQLIELDDLQNECNLSVNIIRHRFHDAHDRVAAWDLPEYQP